MLWFKCAKLALKDPEDGDLLIVGDATQALYKQREFTWADAGVNWRGRSTVLKLNYRNTKEILQAAAGFASATSAGDDDDFSVRTPLLTEDSRISGPRVEVVQCKDVFDEVTRAVARLEGWMKGRDSERRFRPHEIAVLYPRLHSDRHKNALQRLREMLAAYGTTWISGEGADGDYADPGIKITSIHSAKGLQFPAVLLIWADLLPSNFPDRNETQERNLLYVALTRAEHVLAVSHSGASPYLDVLRQNLGLRRSEAVLGQPWLFDLEEEGGQAATLAPQERAANGLRPNEAVSDPS